MYTIELWKDENLIDITAPSYITLNIESKNKGSFKKIIDNIKKISSVDSFSIENFDEGTIKIKIKFFGKIKNFQNNLVENGFDIKLVDNQWNLKLNN